jgi:S-adenosylmethionine hydrolase
MTVVTLLTDFGYDDGYPGVMKGVIWTIFPQVQIADISHTISPQDILQGALILARSARFFPPGTVHVAVIDPGVGTHRRPLAMRLGEHYFVGPDNGLFTLVLERAELNAEMIHIIHLDQPDYWLPDVSHLFHGRDIFAPVAAYLASGVSLDKLGTPVINPVRLSVPKPVNKGSGLLGQVIYIDHFGNLSTNLHQDLFTQTSHVVVNIKGKTIDDLVSTYGDRLPGSLVALIDSSGYLSISLVNGNASESLHATIGDPVELFFL